MEIKGLYKLKKTDQEKLIQTYMDAFQDYPKMMKAFPDMKHSRDRKSLEKIKSHFNE